MISLKKTKKYHKLSEPKVATYLEANVSLPLLAEQVEERIRNEVLHDALNELSPMYRQILFLLYYIEEKSQKEIAQQLGTTNRLWLK